MSGVDTEAKSKIFSSRVGLQPNKKVIVNNVQQQSVICGVN